MFFEFNFEEGKNDLPVVRREVMFVAVESSCQHPAAYNETNLSISRAMRCHSHVVLDQVKLKYQIFIILAAFRRSV